MLKQAWRRGALWFNLKVGVRSTVLAEFKQKISVGGPPPGLDSGK